MKVTAKAILPALLLVFLLLPPLTAFKGVNTVLPAPEVFLTMCGLTPSGVAESQNAVFPARWSHSIGTLEDSDPAVSTVYEALIAFMADMETKVPSSQGQLLLDRLTFRERGLYTLFYLNDLKRLYPERFDYFNMQMSNANLFYKVDWKEVGPFIAEMQRVYLLENVRGNRYFTVYKGNSQSLNPDLKILLDYLSDPVWKNQHRLIMLGRRLTLASFYSERSGRDYYVFTEFTNSVYRYPDIRMFLNQAISWIKVERFPLEKMNGLPPLEKKAMAAAAEIWTELQKYPYDHNDRVMLPEEVRRAGSMDEDDFALWCYILFRRKSVPARVILIDTGAVFPIAYCVFQAGDFWLLIDQDMGIYPGKYRALPELPGNFFQKTVYYRQVDVERYWLKGLSEPRRSIDDGDTENVVLDYEWTTSPYSPPVPVWDPNP